MSRIIRRYIVKKEDSKFLKKNKTSYIFSNVKLDRLQKYALYKNPNHFLLLIFYNFFLYIMMLIGYHKKPNEGFKNICNNVNWIS